jgi:hypothetical protein
MCTTTCPGGAHVAPAPMPRPGPGVSRDRSQTTKTELHTRFRRQVRGNGPSPRRPLPVLMPNKSNSSRQSSGHNAPRVASSTAHCRPSALRRRNCASSTIRDAEITLRCRVVVALHSTLVWMGQKRPEKRPRGA